MALSLLLVAILLLSATATSLAQFDDEYPILPFPDAIQPTPPDELYYADDAFLFALGPSLQTIRFARYAQQYGKNYDSLDEIRKRFEIFSHNWDLIEATNKKGLSYSLGLNRFADLTWEEFRATFLGSKQSCYGSLKGNHVLTNKKLPRTKDWRKDGIVSDVKDQGNCGSCWAFSATGAIEAAYTQLTGKPVCLSEQQLIECSSDNFGCIGGMPSLAFNYIKQSGGIETEETYPYLAKNGKCRFNKTNVAAKVVDTVNITMGSEIELKHAVGIVRPVTVGFEVVETFRFYKKGVYSSNKCRNSPEDLNHALLVIGYGEEGGKPHWLIKNSWGEEWGENGYFKLVFGKNMCGVALCPCYPIVAA